VNSLLLRCEPVGPIVRSAEAAKSVFVSPCHLIDVESSLGLVRATLSGYRHPTPARESHLAANRLRARLRG